MIHMHSVPPDAQTRAQAQAFEELKRAQVGATNCAPPPSEPAFIQILNRLFVLNERLSGALARLIAVNDRALPVPRQIPGKEADCPDHDGAVAAFTRVLAQLHDQAGQIEEEISRLEGVL